jgi:hypothetical protein
MTGKELTDRLIDDIRKTVIKNAQTVDPYAEIKKIGLTGKANLKGILNTFDVSEAEAHLYFISDIINKHTQLFNHNEDDKLDINAFLNDILSSREEIELIFQQLIDNKELIDWNTKEPISKTLIEQLEWIHQAAK